MTLNLHKFICKRVNLHYKITQSRCFRHQHRRNPCQVLLNKNKWRYTTIHGIHENYQVTDYEACCKDYQSKPQWFLFFISRMITPNFSDDYLYINDNDFIFRIYNGFITNSSFIFINEQTMVGQCKNPGSWRSLYRTNYRAQMRINLLKTIKNIEEFPSENLINDIIEEQIPPRKYFRLIWNYMFEYEWQKQESMFIIL